MSWPYSPRTRRRPMGPGSPMWIFGLPRSYFAAGRSDRSARWPSRVWMMKRAAARQGLGRGEGVEKERGVVAERLAETAGVHEVALEVDHDQRGRLRIELEIVRFRLGGELVAASLCLHAQRHRVGHDARPGLPGDGALESRRGCDENLLPPSLEEADRRLDLGAHGSLGELALLQVLLGLRNGDPLEPALVRPAEVDGDLLHARGEDEQRHAQAGRQERRGAVLVDDRLHPPVAPRRLLDDGDAAPAHGDDDEAALDERLDLGRLDDAQRPAAA